MLLTPEQIQGYLPHGPRMQLIDSVKAYDADSLHASTRRHLDTTNPLRRNSEILGVGTGLEFAGQATALHGALIKNEGSQTPRQGLLVMARDVLWTMDRLDTIEEPIEILVTLLSQSGHNAMYHFRMASMERPSIMEGRLAVFFQEGNIP